MVLFWLKFQHHAKWHVGFSFRNIPDKRATTRVLPTRIVFVCFPLALWISTSLFLRSFVDTIGSPAPLEKFFCKVQNVKMHGLMQPMEGQKPCKLAGKF